jgi:hypothetical protein
MKNQDTGNEGIWEHRGYDRSWRMVLGDLPAALYQVVLTSDNRPAFRTQFTATPNGVVITPQNGARSYFYDGYTVAPLGFEQVPGAPSGLGPTVRQENDGADAWKDDTNGNYGFSGLTALDAMGTYRLGTLTGGYLVTGFNNNKANALGGVLEPGMWRAATVWYDKWGNKSAVGNLSNPAVMFKQDNLVKPKKRSEDEAAERLRGQIAWFDFDEGPPHARAMDLLRTRDLKNSGTAKLFAVPQNATQDPLTFSTFATTNITVYPDNIPDEWLLVEAQDTVPVPRFHLSELAFGRLFVAHGGLLSYSEPGFWGTFLRNRTISPDPSGATITGLQSCNKGLLVFTETSTFLISQNEGADPAGSPFSEFMAESLNNRVGCVAPDSCQAMPDGAVVWLGREGFYRYDGTQVQNVSMAIKESILKRINKGWRKQAVAATDIRMGEYRCWIPVDGSQQNNLCLVLDSNGWRRRNDVYAQAVCVKRDHTQNMLALGNAPGANPSLWVLDKEGVDNNQPTKQASILETPWVRSATSVRRSSPARVRIWLRETTSGNITVQSMRDWREYPTIEAESADPQLYSNDDTPPFWDTAKWDETTIDVLREEEDSRTITFVRRRPFWTLIDVHLPSCEVFKIRLTFTGDVEFVGMTHEVYDRDKGGASVPRPAE